MIAFLIGPLSFEYLPDGDDPGTGLLRIRLDGQQVEVECSRDQWDEFVEESGPGFAPSHHEKSDARTDASRAAEAGVTPGERTRAAVAAGSGRREQ